jgi:hypothetical protein
MGGNVFRRAFSGHPWLTDQSWELYDHRDWLWPFLEVAGRSRPTTRRNVRDVTP